MKSFSRCSELISFQPNPHSATKGIREAGTADDHGAVINLTLFRAASGSFPIHNDLIIGFEKETSQCIGEQRFEYSILFDRDSGVGPVIEESEKYTIPVISAELGAGTGGYLKETTSFFRKQENRIIISCIKRAEDDSSIVVRMYNPTAEAITEHIEVAGQLIHAELINMNEDKIADVQVQGNGFVAELSAYKICTFRLEFQQ
ncbi:MAG: glycosyl hydrolase-related protein [Eubacteriales bacterium]|nr:glycosyl hydrolase-related protein [Eubacteriales bacterium]